MSKMRRFHSCFIIDVKCHGTSAILTDSTRGSWSVDLTDVNIANQFKEWMEKIFLKGVPQSLTVFEYEDRAETSMDFDFWIKKFCNLPTEK